MSQREETLVHENDRLRHKLEALTAPSMAIILCQALRLTPKQGAVLALLQRAKRPVSKAAIYTTVFEHDNGDGPDEAIIKSTISFLRRRLRDAGAPGNINGIYDAGHYYLTDDLRGWVSAKIGPDA